MTRWFLLVLFLALPACSKQTGILEPSSFRTTDGAYRITLGDLLDRWTPENFVNWQQKTGDAYQTQIFWTRQNGTTVPATVPLVDLRLTHPQSNGVIWARVIPIPYDLRDKSLRVLAENYANGISGGAFMEGDVRSLIRVERHGSVVVESRPTGVSGFLAHSVTFDIVNLDQLELSSSAPRKRVAIVLVGVDLKRRVGATTQETSYLLLGYANDLTHFDGLARDFGGFVQGVTFDGSVRRPPGLPPTDPGPPPAPPAAPAPRVPATACVPGATQACFGPGGCTGGQACADDGARFLPCDCGSTAPASNP